MATSRHTSLEKSMMKDNISVCLAAPDEHLSIGQLKAHSMLLCTIMGLGFWPHSGLS